MSIPIRCTDGHPVGIHLPGFRAIIATLMADKTDNLETVDLEETKDDKKLEKVFKAFRVDTCEHCRIILMTEKIGII